MIQVCSQCGTRWNVRDRQRVWCPRCNGTLLAPSGSAPHSEWSARPTASALRPSMAQPRWGRPPRLPPGYRWIAVRPGAAPPPRRGRRPLGPTPRYAVIPRWGLVDHFDVGLEQQAAPRTRAVGRDGALHADRDDGGARRRGARARGALRTAHRQPLHAAESTRRGRCHLAWRAGQRPCVVHDGRQRGDADELADRPEGGGVRASRA